MPTFTCGADLQFYVTGLTGLVTRLLELGVTGVAPRTLTQNPLEGLFGIIRRRAGGTVNAAQVMNLLHQQRHSIVDGKQLASHHLYFNLDGRK